MKVLVIEDDPSLREIICRSLEKERYVTEEAPDFQTALEKTADYTSIVFCSTSCYRTETGWICWKN